MKIKNRILIITISIISFLFIVLIISLPQIDVDDDNGRINVIVTILPYAGFVESIGREKVHVTVMIPPGANTHTYEPTLAQLLEVEKADIYFKVGSGVEFELEFFNQIIEINHEMMIIDCSQNVTLIENDPHIWNSPSNAKKIVESICTGLVEIDPDNEAYYETNKESYIQALDDLDFYARNTFDNFTNRVFMIYHPAFGYFANEYNLIQIAIEHEGKQPTPIIIQESIDLANLYNLTYIFVAPQFSVEGTQAIADNIGGQIIFIDPLAKDYINNMKNIVDSLSLEME